jgi:hypothetical protein
MSIRHDRQLYVRTRRLSMPGREQSASDRRTQAGQAYRLSQVFPRTPPVPARSPSSCRP